MDLSGAYVSNAACRLAMTTGQEAALRDLVSKPQLAEREDEGKRPASFSSPHGPCTEQRHVAAVLKSGRSNFVW
jgi:hypothetical protein